MAYSTELVGPGEARLIVLRDFVRDRISLLRSALLMDGIGTSMFASPFAVTPLATNVVQLGDTSQVWLESQGSYNIRVCAGGSQEGIDYTSTQEYTAGPGMSGQRHTYYTNIYLYLHPSLDIMADVNDQAERRERIRERMSDVMLFGIFNTAPLDWSAQDYRPRSFKLGTHILAGGTGTETEDCLTDCRITVGHKGFFYKALGGSRGIFGMHFVHVGHIF